MVWKATRPSINRAVFFLLNRFHILNSGWIFLTIKLAISWTTTENDGTEHLIITEKIKSDLFPPPPLHDHSEG